MSGGMNQDDLNEIEEGLKSGPSTPEEVRALVAEVRRLQGLKAPKKHDFIPFHRPSIYPSHLKAVQEVLESGWLTTAGVCEKFEEAFGKYVGGKHAIAVSSCTAALHLALAALELSPGDEVITSPITFVSAVNVIEQAGGRPVFADVRASDLTIDPESIQALLTDRTKAIIATHLGGIPCRMDEIMAIADKNRLAVITDAAHAIETSYGSKRSGELGHAACYSFYATKNITCGEGGMLVTDSIKLAEYARRMRMHGMDKDAWKRYGPAGYKHWDMAKPGWKYNLSDLNAALGLAQLGSIDNWLGDRRQIYNYYVSEFCRDSRVRLVEIPEDSYPAFHLFAIRIKNRDLAMEKIQERGVGVGVHFRAVTSHSYWRNMEYPHASLKNAEEASDQLLSLPLYPGLGMANAARVVAVVQQVLDEVDSELK